ncbi:MAG TPA: acyl-CoA dehydrogenase family protein, partial [Chloroflexota bacterium]|nr:acyl-CoA dehydrogenase family protein [Chloroflexota bacterium]
MLDYLDLIADVPDSERALAERTRSLLERRVAPRVSDLYEAGEFPRDLIPELGAIGLFGAPLTQFGQASPLAWGLAMRELERVDSGLRSFASVQSCLVMEAIARYGSPSQQSEWLPRLARGEAVGCFALTEPGHGSDPAGLETRATLGPGGTWLLQGRKRWSTNGTLADIAVVWAQTAVDSGSKGVRGFLVPTSEPGFRALPLERKLSLRVSASSELFFENVELPGSSILPRAAGLGAPLSCLN